jgi:hypothetical protein
MATNPWMYSRTPKSNIKKQLDHGLFFTYVFCPIISANVHLVWQDVNPLPIHVRILEIRWVKQLHQGLFCTYV